MLLRLQGHRVRVATDGEAALRAAQESQPEIAFIDLNMPGVDGFEVARRLRDAPGGNGIVLAALTGMGQQADIARTREAGFQVHLTEPADPRAVAALLSENQRSGSILQRPRCLEPVLTNYEPGGRGFKSWRARQLIQAVRYESS